VRVFGETNVGDVAAEVVVTVGQVKACPEKYR
jgi:hypothetical protein